MTFIRLNITNSNVKRNRIDFCRNKWYFSGTYNTIEFKFHKEIDRLTPTRQLFYLVKPT